MESKNTVTSYKGFDAKLQCRKFQYEIGKTYEHTGSVEACRGGFHACEHPLNVFSYYPPASSRFALVEQSGDLSREAGGDTKLASRKITIKAELSLAGLIKAAIEFTFSRAQSIDPASPASATGDQGAASATGDQGAASATGDQGAASATGYQGAASATGDQGAASATGRYSAASATGRYSAASAVGFNGRAKGSDGSALFLVFRHYDYGADDHAKILHARAVIVGQDGIKPETWYALNDNGEVVEAA